MLSTCFAFLAHLVTSVISFLGYPGVFLLMLLESCGIPVPSEVIMPFAGFLVATGRFNFWAVVIVGTLANLAGSLLAYWIGRRGGQPLIEKYGRYILISRHDLDLADRWFAKYGGEAVFFGRLLPIVRTYISFPAGIAEMPLKKFAGYTLAGALPWCILFTWLGVKLQNNWEIVKQTLHNFDLTILLLLILAISWHIYSHLKKRTR